MIRTVYWEDDCAVLIDQTRLPHDRVHLRLNDYRAMAHAIRVMQVRGAPAIGVAAALGMALAARQAPSGDDRSQFDSWMDVAGQELCVTRPTAVNLSWAVERLLNLLRRHPEWSVEECRNAVVGAAREMVDEDIAACRSLAQFGAELVPRTATILTHCNAGALACAGYGTALGIVRAAVESGKQIQVFADETRPRLQGAQLTCWELKEDGIPVTVVPDNAAGALMRQGRVDLVVVGADRIAANGDTANKIGTYNLAVLAKENGVPFYVAAPISTVDLNIGSGKDIPIEERGSEEVTCLQGARIAPEGVPAINLAFDVTPAVYITAIVTENGVARPPFQTGLRELIRAPNP